MASDLSLFLGQLIRKPDQVVALAPSSAALAREMCAGLSAQTGAVAELGPGTGKITKAITEAGVKARNITAFELNPAFCDTLQSRFPEADIRNAPAQDLGTLPAGSLDSVISGLPLLSMPNTIQEEILTGAFHALRPGGTFVQFTYGPTPPVASQLRNGLGLSWTRSHRIWGNLPPARVYTFRQSLN